MKLKHPRFATAIFVLVALAASLTLPAAADTGESTLELQPAASRLAAGADFTCALHNDGTVQCWGDNYFGQLGSETNNQIQIDNPVPQPVFSLASPGIAITAGTNHTCALLDNGSVQCWGMNLYGQLGSLSNLGEFDANPTPQSAINFTSPATAISAGTYFTCALLDNGSVQCWGINATGQLGSDTNIGSSDPVIIPQPPITFSAPAVAIAAGGDHACALLTDGTVQCWGSNSKGQLGSATATTFVHAPQPTASLDATVTAITAGDQHTCALLEDGTIQCWGNNYFGQLGSTETFETSVGTSTPQPPVSVISPAVAISAGFAYTCALQANGRIKCWGDNSFDVVTYGGGAYASPQGNVHSHANGLALSAGRSHSCSLLYDGSIKCWGSNKWGQIALESTSGGDQKHSDAGPRVPIPVIGIPPAHDVFANAISIGSDATATFSTTSLHATGGDSDPAFLPNCTTDDGTDSSVWYYWTAPASAEVTIDLAGTAFDTIMTVFTGSTVETLTPLVCNDDSSGVQSKVTFDSVQGTRYSIQIDGFNGVDGLIEIALSLRSPANTKFSSPVDLGSVLAATVSAHNYGATPDIVEPLPLLGNCAVAPSDINSTWYTWTAPGNGQLHLTTTSPDLDTVLATYIATARIAETGCDSQPSSNDATLDQTVISGTTYHIQVFGNEGQTGPFTLDLAYTADPPPTPTPNPTTVPPPPTPTPTATPHIPSGTSDSYAVANLEELESGPGEIRVHGWSYDPDLPTKDLVVHVYAFYDGVGEPVALDTPVVRAADFRPDINRAFDIEGDHGFNSILAIRNGTHRICVYSLSVDGTGELDGLNELIGCRYVTITDKAPPRGAFDKATQTGTSLTVSGWAYDLDSENDSLNVQVYLDGAFHTTIPANTSRPDVNKIVQISGDHGFNSTFTVPAGPHNVCLYVIGVDPTGTPDGENVLLNVIDQPDCRTT